MSSIFLSRASFVYFDLNSICELDLSTVRITHSRENSWKNMFCQNFRLTLGLWLALLESNLSCDFVHLHILK